MKWTELQIQTSNEAVDAVSNILIESGSQGVAIEDIQDFFNTPDDGFGEIWALDEADFSKEGVIIKAYFPDTLFLPVLVHTLPNLEQQLKIVLLAKDGNIFSKLLPSSLPLLLLFLTYSALSLNQKSPKL